MNANRCLALALALSGLCAAQDLNGVRARMADLGADDWAVREEATTELQRMVCVDATGATEREVARGLTCSDPEVVERCRLILAALADDRFEIVVLEVEGEAECQDARKAPWRVVKAGMRVPRGARLCTGVGGRIVLSFGDYARVALQEASILEIRSIRVEANRLTGTLFVDPGVVQVLKGDEPSLDFDLEIHTPRLPASVR